MNTTFEQTKVFNHPFTCMIAGPTQSGKTTFLKNVLLNNQLLIDKTPQKIVYCYSSFQETFKELSGLAIEFKEGLPSIGQNEEKSQSSNLKT